MKIIDKIKMNREGLKENGAITIVAFGDSITYGAVGPDEVNYETVYWNRLRQKINSVRNYVPVNVINAGIGGTTARESLNRMDKQVFIHEPDLLIICFGLNDVKKENLEDYTAALRIMFEKSNRKGIETIFMTPNMLNTYVSEEVDEDYQEYARITAEMQNNGRMDTFMKEACKVADDMGIKVCDCYSKWKEISKTQDTTMLLANRINHPIAEMHELFAKSLFEMIFGEEMANITI